MATCDRSHPSCAPRGGTADFVPRRLISIGYGDTELRLIDTKECYLEKCDFSQYAALSYCWGNSNHSYRTTRENLNANKQGIQVSKLPKVT
jgi:hypothetical protein